MKRYESFRLNLTILASLTEEERVIEIHRAADDYENNTSTDFSEAYKKKHEELTHKEN